MNEEAIKLTSYFGERHRTAGGRFSADALLDLYGQHKVATSILLRGAEGFGAKRHQRTDMSLTLSEDLPLTAVAVDSRSAIEPLIEPTARITGTGLVTLERARLLRDDIGTEDIEAVTPRYGTGEETKLTIYLGRQERSYRMPAFMAVCDLLHRRGVAGATVLLGVDGTARHPRAGRLLQPQRGHAGDGHRGRFRCGGPPGAAGTRCPAAPAAAHARAGAAV